MSKPKEIAPLPHGLVQKKIIHQPPKRRARSELLCPNNKYRDENFVAYTAKKKEFLDACSQYNRLQRAIMLKNKKYLLEDYRQMITCDFLEEETEDGSIYLEPSGLLLRKRTERPIFQEAKQKKQPFTMASWFAKYFILNKFIWAARQIILKNRLLWVLSKLKRLKINDIRAFEKHERKYMNVSYAEIFDRFL